MFGRLGFSFLIASSVFYSCGASFQAPLRGWGTQFEPAESYVFKWPIRRVAIIGSGPGGILSYREFVKAGFDVHVFERDNMPGGNWHYTEEVPDKAPIPNAEISVGDYIPSLPPKGAKLPYEERYAGCKAKEIARSHRAPKPVWATLSSNAPAPAQQIEEFPWPAGTSWQLHHTHLTKYIRGFASYHGVNSNDDNPRVSYNTRVELVEKRYDENGLETGWTLTLKELVRTGPSSLKAIWTKEDFDAIVVATGRYNAPNMPSIPGLSEWGKAFPDRIFHSRQYRRPEFFANQTVVVVGAGNSGGEIARDLDKHATKIFTSVRPDTATAPHFRLKFLLRRLPPSVEVVGEIKRFLPPTPEIRTSSIEFTNGTVLSGIDSIIFATGFRYSFPFLPQYHNSSIGLNETGPSHLPQPFVTDGSHLRNLYLDVFYVEEPTIGFVNMNIGMQSFTYAEYISVALSKVWSGKAKLPSTRDLWLWNEQHRQDLGGYGKHYQFLGSERTNEMIRFFVGWLNDAAVKYGGRQVNGQNSDAAQIVDIWVQARFGSLKDIESGGNSTTSACGDIVLNKGTMKVHCGESHMDAADIVFDDYW